MLTNGIDREDATGYAFKGMIGRGHRLAGNGGMEDTELIVDDTLGDNIWITSLVQWLKEMRLNLRSNGDKKTPRLAAKIEEGKKEKIIMNQRGIVLRGETEEGVDGETVNIRVGQCWKKGNEIIEIVGLGDETAEVIIWEGKKIEVGQRVKVNKRNKYRGYPMGMGARKVIRREEIGMEGI